MISIPLAKKMSEHYARLIDKLMDAQIKLTDGGVKSYTIDDRSLTRFDLDGIALELEKAIKKKAEYDAIIEGRRPRKAVAIVPRDY